jgi:hypothetical protein
MPLALKGGHVEFTQVLVERGADVNAQDNSDSTPLHLASRGRHVGFAQVLVEHGANVNAQDQSRSTSLHLALKDGHVDFTQMLVEHGADVNAQDNSKSTPLHLALWGGHVAQMLVEHGADVNAQDNSDSTPLHLASRGGHVVLFEHWYNCACNIHAPYSKKTDGIDSIPIPIVRACVGVSPSQYIGWRDAPRTRSMDVRDDWSLYGTQVRRNYLNVNETLPMRIGRRLRRYRRCRRG